MCPRTQQCMCDEVGHFDHLMLGADAQWPFITGSNEGNTRILEDHVYQGNPLKRVYRV